MLTFAIYYAPQEPGLFIPEITAERFTSSDDLILQLMNRDEGDEVPFAIVDYDIQKEHARLGASITDAMQKFYVHVFIDGWTVSASLDAAHDVLNSRIVWEDGMPGIPNYEGTFYWESHEQGIKSEYWFNQKELIANRKEAEQDVAARNAAWAE